MLMFIFRLVYQHFCQRYFAVFAKVPAAVRRPVGLTSDGLAAGLRESPVRVGFAGRHVPGDPGGPCVARDGRRGGSPIWNHTPDGAFRYAPVPLPTGEVVGAFHSAFCHELRSSFNSAMPLGPAVGWARRVSFGGTSRVGLLYKVTAPAGES